MVVADVLSFRLVRICFGFRFLTLQSCRGNFKEEYGGGRKYRKWEEDFLRYFDGFFCGTF